VIVPGGLKRVGCVFGLFHLNHVHPHKLYMKVTNVFFGGLRSGGQANPLNHGMFAHGR
jgi:hypothetical protein